MGVRVSKSSSLAPQVNGTLREWCTKSGDEFTLRMALTTENVLCMHMLEFL